MNGRDSAAIRLDIADESCLMSDGLRCLLSGERGIDVLALVDDSTRLTSVVEEVEPDAVLISLRAHVPSSMSVIREARHLRETRPELGIVIISDRGNGFALELLRGGSARTAYLLDEKLSDVTSVVMALREVMHGQTVLDASVVDSLVLRREAVAIDHLTLRELEVLEQIANGLSNRAVATELAITIKAVENHVTSIFRKLDLTDRTDSHQRVAAALAYLDRTHGLRPSGADVDA